MNAKNAVTKDHEFDPRTGCCQKCGISQIEMHAMLQRLASYQLLDVVFSQRRDAADWTISQETRDLYAQLACARHCV